MGTRNLVYSLILLTLITFKVTAATLHISLHHSQDRHEHSQDGHNEGQCEFCEFAIQFQNLEFPYTFPTEIPTNTTIPYHRAAPTDVETLKVSITSVALLFTRPPPKA